VSYISSVTPARRRPVATVSSPRGRLSRVSEPTPAVLPATALATTADEPWPVRHLSPKIAEYVARMSPVWVEGQVLNVKRWNQLWFLTLRDTVVDMSVSVTLPHAAVQAV